MKPRTSLDRPMAAAELARVRAETEKLRLENEALKSAKTKKDSVFDIIGRFGTAATALVAVAGLITSTAALFSSYNAWQNSDREKLNSLLTQLGSVNQSERYYALTSLLNRDINSADVENSVLDALVNEKSFSIKIVSTKPIIAKKYSSDVIDAITSRLDLLSLREIAELEDIARKRDKIADKDQSSQSYANYDASYKNKLTDLQGEADSLVTLAFIKAQTNCQSAPCPLDLSTLSFKHYSFMRYPYPLKGVKFAAAALWAIDFSETSLDSANFKDAYITTSEFLETSLKSADFRGAMFLIPNPHEFSFTDLEKTMRGRSTFDHADLSGAIFDDACLTGVDFVKAKGLKPEQFLKSFNKGALFSDDLTDKLKKLSVLDKGDEKCESYDPQLLPPPP